MKVILTIFSGLMALFTGGCGLLLGGSLGLVSLILLGIAALNLLMILAMYGYTGPMRPAFITLIVADLVVAGGLLLLGFVGSISDPSVLPLAMLLAGAFLVKAGLSYGVMRQLHGQ
jgi:hypothetical protein